MGQRVCYFWIGLFCTAGLPVSKCIENPMHYTGFSMELLFDWTIKVITDTSFKERSLPELLVVADGFDVVGQLVEGLVPTATGA